MVKRGKMHPTRRAPPERIVLGIDPGLALTGYAVLRVQRATITCLACGVLSTAGGTPLPERLLVLYEQMDALLTRYAPTDVVVETLFIGSNRSTALAVGHARGVLLLAIQQRHLPISEYAPATIKRIVTGRGDATKVQVGRCVRVILRLATIPRPDDAADAAAAALCHVFTVFPQLLKRKAQS